MRHGGGAALPCPSMTQGGESREKKAGGRKRRWERCWEREEEIRLLGSALGGQWPLQGPFQAEPCRAFHPLGQLLPQAAPLPCAGQDEGLQPAAR